jgi:hypothetical protein
VLESEYRRDGKRNDHREENEQTIDCGKAKLKGVPTLGVHLSAPNLSMSSMKPNLTPKGKE